MRHGALLLPLVVAYGCGGGNSPNSENECSGLLASVTGISQAQAGRLVRSAGVEPDVEAFDFIPLGADETVSLDELVIGVEMDYERGADAEQGSGGGTASCAPNLESSDDLETVAVLADRPLGTDLPPGSPLENVINIVPRLVRPSADPSVGGAGAESGVSLESFTEDTPPVPLAFILDFVDGNVVEAGPYTFSISVALENGSTFVSEVAVPTLTK